MATDIKIVEEASPQLGMNPRKFALWLFIVTVCMLFAAWTSAYIVKRADGQWSEIVLPNQFIINTILMLISSATMIWAQRAARQDNVEKVKLALSLTVVLGLAFLGGQLIAYGKLVDTNQYFVGGNVSSSFVYVLTGMHGLHLVGGIVFLLIVLRLAFVAEVHSKSMMWIEMCSTYWHFLGGLWVYLYVFLSLNR